MAGPLAKIELLLKDALEGMVNGKKVRSTRRYQIIDNIMINGLHEVAVDLGFTTLLTSQVISVTFYSEHEKSNKFCSEALISA